MIKVMKNIMIVSALIMVQIQSVYASGEEDSARLDTYWTRALVRGNSRLCYSDAVLFEALHMMRSSCLLEGLNRTCIQRIKEATRHNSKIKDFLYFRKEVRKAAESLLPLLDKAHEENQKAFVALAAILRLGKAGHALSIDSPCPCPSMRDAYHKVLIFLDNNKSAVDSQEKYSTKVLDEVSSGFPALNDATLSALDCYQQSLKQRAELRKYSSIFESLYDREKSFFGELELVQNILEEENGLPRILVGMLRSAALFTALTIRDCKADVWMRMKAIKN